MLDSFTQLIVLVQRETVWGYFTKGRLLLALQGWQFALFLSKNSYCWHYVILVIRAIISLSSFPNHHCGLLSAVWIRWYAVLIGENCTSINLVWQHHRGTLLFLTQDVLKIHRIHIQGTIVLAYPIVVALLVSFRIMLLIEHFASKLLVLNKVRRLLLRGNWMRLLSVVQWLLIEPGELRLLDLLEVSLLAVRLFDSLNEACRGVAVDWNGGRIDCTEWLQAVNIARLHIHVLLDLLGVQGYWDVKLLSVAVRFLMPQCGIYLSVYLPGKGLLVANKIALSLV